MHLRSKNRVHAKYAVSPTFHVEAECSELGLHHPGVANELQQFARIAGQPHLQGQNRRLAWSRPPTLTSTQTHTMRRVLVKRLPLAAWALCPRRDPKSHPSCATHQTHCRPRPRSSVNRYNARTPQQKADRPHTWWVAEPTDPGREQN